jgi:aspartate kinase
MTNNIRVLKFGGSSLATPDHIRRVAEQVAGYAKAGQGIVVVASAMGGTTEKLLSLAGAITDNPPLRELDKLLSTGESISTALLCMELQRLGLEAVSLDGSQCGIITSDNHFNATVQHVDTTRVLEELGAGRIVVSAGFQGRNSAGEITTLGRGGSDTTAVVLAAALNVARCEICSDVDGVYSADPRIVEDARRIDVLGYDEMIEMARHGASVLNPCAVEHARTKGVEIFARSSFEPDRGGTLIHDFPAGEPRIVGYAGHDSLVSFTLNEYTDVHGEPVAKLLDGLEADDILIDEIDSASKRRHIVIPTERLPDAASFTEALESHFHERLVVDEKSSSVSVIGLGVGRIDQISNALHSYSKQSGVDLRTAYSGEHSVACMVCSSQSGKLMNVFHGGFEVPARNAA